MSEEGRVTVKDASREYMRATLQLMRAVNASAERKRGRATQTAPDGEAPKKRPAKKLPPHPECAGVWEDGDKACAGGTKSDTLVDWEQHRVCITCREKAKRFRKKNKK